MTDVNAMIDEIQRLPHFRNLACTKCSGNMRVHALQICSVCERCGTLHKCRGFGAIGTELGDLIDAVLVWCGQGEEFEAVMVRRAELLEPDPEPEE